jgi:hypothetical protein
MQERGIDPAEGLEVWRLFAHAFPFFIVPIVALFAVFRSNKDLFNFRHPVGRSLCLLRNGAAMIQADDAHNEREEEACGYSWCVPSAS